MNESMTYRYAKERAAKGSRLWRLGVRVIRVMAKMMEYMNMESCRAEISAPEVGLSVRNTADSLAGVRKKGHL